MSAKSKKRRKAKRAFDRTADAQSKARMERLYRAFAERERIASAVAHGTATDQEQAAHEAYEKRREEYRKMSELIPPNVLYDGPMTWEAIHARFCTGNGND